MSCDGMNETAIFSGLTLIAGPNKTEILQPKCTARRPTQPGFDSGGSTAASRAARHYTKPKLSGSKSKSIYPSHQRSTESEYARDKLAR